MTDDRTIGSVIDALGVTPTLRDTDLVTDVVVIVRVTEEDGSERLSTAWSAGLSWVTRSGMLHNARLADDSSNQRSDP